MIYYNSDKINNWNFGDDNIIKVYRNNAVCYYKVVSSGGTTSQTPCYAVVEDISLYEDTEFEDVFNKADEKWYKLNNLNEYEEYGIYGSGRTQCGGSPIVEYIERDSTHNGYIPLGEYFTEDTVIQIDFQMTQSKGWSIIGDYHNTDQDDWRIFLNYDTQINNLLNYDFDTTRVQYNTGDWSKRFHLEIGNYYIKDLDTGNYLINSTPKTNFSRPNQMYLFYLENAGAAPYDFGRIYSVKIYKNNVLVKDFIPWTDGNGNYGLYDNVSSSATQSIGSMTGYTTTPSCITTYEGKLTIDDGYEYIYSGGSWVNVGEVSGSTAQLPNVPFSVNYNAKSYNESTKTLLKTSGQLVDVDAVITAGTPTVSSDHLTIATSARATITGYQNYFNRTNSEPNITIISKHKTDGSNYHIFANRDSAYNWMYRPSNTQISFHGTNMVNGVTVTSQPVIASVRVDSNRWLTFNNYTDNTSSTASSQFSYGSVNNGKFAMFAGYASQAGEWFSGDFYWIYMSQNTLTDEQIQQVITYNEEGGGETVYPLYYDEKQDPPQSVSFSSMTEAEEYECPYVGLDADIDGTDYIFDENYNWVTKYGLFEVSGYVCDSGDKYQKMEEKVRNVDNTWSSQDPPVYEKGELIESASTDCGQVDYEKEYLTFRALESGTFKFSGNPISYSTDSGVTWAELASNTNSPTIQSGETIMWKASGLTITASTTSENGGMGVFSSSGRYEVEGNIYSIISGDSFTSADTSTIEISQLKNLFNGSTGLTSAENLVMPTKTLNTHSYYGMFKGCTNMVTPPQIPFTTGGDNSCGQMFRNCTSMLIAPAITATTITGHTFNSTFIGCSSMTTVPMLAAETLYSASYYNMFSGCTSLNSITCLAKSGINSSNSTYNWVKNVASSGTFYKNPDASWPSGTNGIPSNWTVQDYVY